MAGEDVVVALQPAQAAQGHQNFLPAAPPQVGAAAVPGKEGVAGKEGVPRLQGDRPGGVARGVEHLNGQAAQGEGVPLVIEQKIVHLPRQGEQTAARPVGVGLVDIDFGFRQGLVQLGHGGGVVVVAVGEKDILHLRIGFFQLTQDAPRFVAGVNHGDFVVVFQNIAVSANGAHLHQFDVHKLLLFSPACQTYLQIRRGPPASGRRRCGNKG